jgi:Cd2+/Zn2+-exporting ATPase
VALAGVLIAVGAGADLAGASVLGFAAYATSIALSVPRPARRAFEAVRQRSLDINALMIIAVAGAAGLGDWLEAASVVWLFGIAQWLEARSLERARYAIASLVTLAPTEALVRRDGVETRLPADRIVPGDIVVVRPGERIAVDGVVSAGQSDVDESPITGESRPAEKAAGAAVFSGTVNGAGALEIEVSRAAADSTLARIVRLVEDAQKRRAPVQTLVDRFARRYTPAVVVLAVVVAIGPPLLLGGISGWTTHAATWGYRALALLVVACPCALVISTPVSIVSALTAAARGGVLIKGGAHLERLSAVRCVAFDKTGTLTQGRVSVTGVLPMAGQSTHDLLSVAAALEARSEHPIGRAIVAHAHGEGLAFAPGEGFRALPGFGAEATVAAIPAIVGNHRLFEQRQLCTPDLHAFVTAVEGRGETPVLVSHGGSPIGMLTLTDEVRTTGRHAIAGLREQGIERVVLLTGDARVSAQAVREGLDLDEAHAELRPEDKVEQVQRLRSAYGPVAMVGDGINDAPALATADVGIAMGVAGTDVALETADVALMTDDLNRLPYAFRLGRAALANIRANIALALGLKLIFVVLATAGLATLWMAVLADTGASLIVTANSLRLLKVR